MENNVLCLAEVRWECAGKVNPEAFETICLGIQKKRCVCGGGGVAIVGAQGRRKNAKGSLLAAIRSRFSLEYCSNLKKNTLDVNIIQTIIDKQRW